VPLDELPVVMTTVELIPVEDARAEGRL